MKYCFLLFTAAFAWAQQPPVAAPPLAPGAPPQPAVAPDAVIITIGDSKITRAQFEQILSTIPPQQRGQFSTPMGKRRLAEQFVELETMAQEARARKIDEQPTVKAEITLRVDQTLAQVLYQDLLAQAKPDDAALHSYYDAHKADFEEVKAKHILIRSGANPAPAPGAAKQEKARTDAEALALANDIRAKILAGSSFDELAKAYSDDSSNAPNGGELGTFEHGRMVPQFEKAAFAAEPGKVTEPVKTQFGYHLILVEEHKTKTFDEVRAQIEQKIKPELAQKTVSDLKAKAKVVYDDAYFGKAPSLGGPPVPAPAKPQK